MCDHRGARCLDDAGRAHDLAGGALRHQGIARPQGGHIFSPRNMSRGGPRRLPRHPSPHEAPGSLDDAGRARDLAGGPIRRRGIAGPQGGHIFSPRNMSRGGSDVLPNEELVITARKTFNSGLLWFPPSTPAPFLLGPLSHDPSPHHLSMSLPVYRRQWSDGRQGRICLSHTRRVVMALQLAYATRRHLQNLA